ncbi:MAG: PepSY domain-containing protein [Gammaproteobacteria bacterium]
MNTSRHSILCLVLLTLASESACARNYGLPPGGPDGGEGGVIVVADGGMSLDQAVSMVEKRFKARVVRTEVRTEGNRKVYVLRLLNDAGRVWTVRVDASSGSVS